jgi:lipopolysaccharide/colanic/teichoic acid biosynthesis glycosyltransferase
LASIPVPHQAAHIQDPTWQAVAICERLASVVLFAALSPILLASALALSWLSGRAPLIAHRRVGWRGATLWMLKLRTMWNSEGRDTRRPAGRT